MIIKIRVIFWTYLFELFGCIKYNLVEVSDFEFEYLILLDGTNKLLEFSFEFKFLI